MLLCTHCEKPTSSTLWDKKGYPLCPECFRLEIHKFVTNHTPVDPKLPMEVK